MGDYSFIVAMLTCARDAREVHQSRSVFKRSGLRCSPCGGGYRSSNALNVPQKEVYYFGIIDILQPYNLRKRVEHALKSVIEGEEAMSCVDPDTYASRFQAFLVQKLLE